MTAASGNPPKPLNPLKTTTVEVYRLWQDELSQLQRRWNEIKANAQEERGEVSEEAEGLRQRIQGLRDLLTEAFVVGEDPSSWKVEIPSVRLGSMVRVAFDDGTTDDFLFIGLAGPTMEGNVLTPKTPLGAAILGRQVGEKVAYQVGPAQYQAIVTRCAIPRPADATGGPAGDGIRIIIGTNEEDEADRVAKAAQELLRGGMPASEVVVAWYAPYQSRPFETVFAGKGIRYRLEGADGFFEHPAVRGILALLRLLINPNDGSSLFLAMRTFTHAPGEALERLSTAWVGPDQTVLPSSLGGHKDVTGLLQAMYKVWPRSAGMRPEKALLELAGRLEKLRPEYFGDEFNTVWPAVVRAAAPHQKIEGFLTQADETAAKSKRGSRDGLILTPLSLIGSREFTALFLVGLNEGAFPLLAKGPDSMAEERELFYEALTAPKFAALSWSATIGGKAAKQSRFIAEVIDVPQSAWN